MMKIALFFTLVVAAAWAAQQIPLDNIENVWADWKAEYGMTFSALEEPRRLAIFTDNVRYINNMNNLYAPDTQFGLNLFAHLSRDEFRQQYLSRPIEQETVDELYRRFPTAIMSKKQIQDTPDAWDWLVKGAVTPVKNQGSCGSCWSFSTTGNLEGQWFLAGNPLTSLSEQNLVDCDHHCMTYEKQNVCDSGCNGGLMMNAFQYVMGNGGIDTEASYPYRGVDGSCSFNSKNVGAKIKNWTMIGQSEDQMMAYCYANGPISIAADATEWQFYMGGIFRAPCGKQLDHGILITGWNHQKDMFGKDLPYWIVKNSWGPTWGKSGYIWLERNKDECAITATPCSGIV